MLASDSSTKGTELVVSSGLQFNLHMQTLIQKSHLSYDAGGRAISLFYKANMRFIEIENSLTCICECFKQIQDVTGLTMSLDSSTEEFASSAMSIDSFVKQKDYIEKLFALMDCKIKEGYPLTVKDSQIISFLNDYVLNVRRYTRFKC